MSKKEIWKKLPGYEEYYQISNFGRVKSTRWVQSRNCKKNNILCIYYPSERYADVRFKINGEIVLKQLHRLVCLLFNKKKKYSYNVVNHINGDIHDNRACNLEWTDHSGNMLHSMRFSGIERFGSKNPNSKYDENQVDALRNLCSSGVSVYKAAKICGFKMTTAYYIINKKLRSNEISATRI